MKSVRSLMIAALGAASLFASLPGQAREKVEISLPGASIRLPAPPLLPGVSVRLPAPPVLPLPGVVVVEERRHGGFDHYPREVHDRYPDHRRDDWRWERARDDWRYDHRRPPPPRHHHRHHHHDHYDRW